MWSRPGSLESGVSTLYPCQNNSESNTNITIIINMVIVYNIIICNTVIQHTVSRLSKTMLVAIGEPPCDVGGILLNPDDVCR